MEGKKLVLMVQLIIVYSLYIPPRRGPTLCGGKVLDRVELEVREVGYLSSHLAVATCAESVCSVREDEDSSYGLLNPRSELVSLFRSEERPLLFYDRK